MKLASQHMRIRIWATTIANIERSRYSAHAGSTLVVGNLDYVEAISCDMSHVRTPSHAMRLLKQDPRAFSEVIVFSDQIAASPVGQIFIVSGSGIASVSSFEILCAMRHAATISFESGQPYAVSSDGRGQKRFLAALNEFLIIEESKPGSVAHRLASRRTRRCHLLNQIHRIQQHRSLIMQEIYLGRLGLDEGQMISNRLKDIEKCARKDLLECTTQ